MRAHAQRKGQNDLDEIRLKTRNVLDDWTQWL